MLPATPSVNGHTLQATRRDFGRTLAASALGVIAAPAVVLGRGASETLNVAIVGAGGRGADNHKTIKGAGQNIVALCDVDGDRLAEAARLSPQAKTFRDFRKLLDELHRSIDAVVVSTPDHTHAVIARAAMELGKHVYCEKPLTHSIREARVLAETARRQKVATQMGNAGHSSEGTRRVVELVRSGAIGPVKEVHAWTNRPIWPQGIDRPAERPPVPASLDWDLWLGPAPERPYHPAYHPFKWRGFWDFGTGALGDMGCHIIDAAFWALDLGAPACVEAEGPPPSEHPETAPAWSIVRYEFPAKGGRPPVKLTWYDGGKFPPADLFDGHLPAKGSSGSLFVGARGRLLVSRERGRGFLVLPEKDFKDFEPPKPTLPRSPGHHQEWIEACRVGSPTGTNFDYAGPLTELVLLGNVALRAGRKIEWDAASAQIKNGSLDDLFLHRENRPGWAL
ncbi:MAG: Gfo/Idh/MocA family oxidoreductase [Isosphaeraceae bacterium]